MRRWFCTCFLRACVCACVCSRPQNRKKLEDSQGEYTAVRERVRAGTAHNRVIVYHRVQLCVCVCNFPPDDGSASRELRHIIPPLRQTPHPGTRLPPFCRHAPLPDAILCVQLMQFDVQYYKDAHAAAAAFSADIAVLQV